MRLAKQIVYGTVFLIILALIGYGLVRLLYNPAPSCFDNVQNQGETGVDCGGPCIPCAIKSLQPIQVQSQKAFKASDGTGVAVEIYNPNPDWGAQSFDYTITLKDQFGHALQTESGKSFIYPGELKYIIEPYIKQDVSTVTSVATQITNPQWISGTVFSKPNIDAQGIRTDKDTQVYVSGNVVNQSEFPFASVVVDALVYNRDGVLIAASKTTIDAIKQFNSSPFKISFAPELSIYQPQIAPSITFSRTFQFGDTGSDVSSLQGILREYGLMTTDPTGYFDDATRQALTQFQQQHGIAASGAFDTSTMQYVQNLITSQTPQQNQQTKDTSVDPVRTRVFVEAEH